MMGKACPKPPRAERSEVYLKDVRRMPCCLCGLDPGGEAHHVRRRGHGAAGRKPGDLWTVPLCRHCHQRVHDQGAENVREWLLEAAHAALVAIVVEFDEEGLIDLMDRDRR